MSWKLFWAGSSFVVTIFAFMGTWRAASGERWEEAIFYLLVTVIFAHVHKGDRKAYIRERAQRERDENPPTITYEGHWHRGDDNIGFYPHTESSGKREDDDEDGWG